MPVFPTKRQDGIGKLLHAKRRRDASMAIIWISWGMFEAQKGFRRINARRRLPLLRRALARNRGKPPVGGMENAAQGFIAEPCQRNFAVNREIAELSPAGG